VPSEGSEFHEIGAVIPVEPDADIRLELSEYVLASRKCDWHGMLKSWTEPEWCVRWFLNNETEEIPFIKKNPISSVVMAPSFYSFLVTNIYFIS
jgi:hypothetical protein